MPPGNEEGVAGRDGNRIEACFDRGDVLRCDIVPQLGRGGRTLEADVDVAGRLPRTRRRAGNIVARAEDKIGLGLAARRIEFAPGEFARGMRLEGQPGPAVEKLHEELRLCAVFPHVGGAQKIFRVGTQQLREIARRRIVSDADL